MSLFYVDLLNYDHDKINTKTYKNQENIEYVIISSKIETNDEGLLKDNEFPEYRSLIKTQDNNLLCVSPPSSIDFDSFSTFFSKQENKDIMINEIVEGTMINLFYDERIQSWEITTRTYVGCNNWFTSMEYDEYGEKSQQQKTFRQMFYDAIGSTDLNHFFQLYNTNYCYSFVLQHPYNHMVLPIEVPRLYLVAVYEIINSSKYIDYQSYTVYVRSISLFSETDQHSCIDFINEHFELYHNIFIPLLIKPSNKNLVDFGKEYNSFETDSFEMPDYFVRSFFEHVSNYYTMGLMLTHMKTGKRTCISNKIYEYIKQIRGNNPNLQYQFFELKKSTKIDEFLYYFSIYKPLFDIFEKKYQDFITNVHQTYYSYYVLKSGQQMPKQYFIHAAKIHHEIFLPEKRIIRRNVVVEYFLKFTPSELMYYMVNFQKEKTA